ncbi:cobalt-precorrin-6A reductase [Labrenzia sp. VG12]|uniref:cobalt-precorrin-6A reductase n=1 Tax=Labrenzia sp. VG12 TaxID=2021862 RepID=UPI0018E0298C|nr:cobalt-precorrin-6A reductase [Labrenzia sp. VG12]
MTHDHILLLAGTHEARQLARALSKTFPETRLTASFAGAVSDLPDLGVPTRVGGFGGVDGLRAYLAAEAVTIIVDATHPFAAQMSRNAAAAADLPLATLLRLDRPGWTAESGDTWQSFGTLKEAAAALPTGARVFLSVGRTDIGLFTHRTDLFGLARMIEPPSEPLPPHWQLILARPPQAVEEELSLMETHRITHLVTKNSGGTRAFAKIAAARRLSLPVFMISRPDLPEAETAGSVDEMIALVKGHLGPVAD